MRPSLTLRQINQVAGDDDVPLRGPGTGVPINRRNDFGAGIGVEAQGLSRHEPVPAARVKPVALEVEPEAVEDLLTIRRHSERPAYLLTGIDRDQRGDVLDDEPLARGDRVAEGNLDDVPLGPGLMSTFRPDMNGCNAGLSMSRTASKLLPRFETLTVPATGSGVLTTLTLRGGGGAGVG
jgi:hypothetical protein